MSKEPTEPIVVETSKGPVRFHRVGEPIVEQLDEYLDHEFVVQLSIRESQSAPSEEEIKRVLYQGLAAIDTEDAILVTGPDS